MLYVCASCITIFYAWLGVRLLIINLVHEQQFPFLVIILELKFNVILSWLFVRGYSYSEFRGCLIASRAPGVFCHCCVVIALLNLCSSTDLFLNQTMWCFACEANCPAQCGHIFTHIRRQDNTSRILLFFILNDLVNGLTDSFNCCLHSFILLFQLFCQRQLFCQIFHVCSVVMMIN